MHSDNESNQSKDELLRDITKHYKSGLEYYRNSNFKAAEIDFVKSIRPILSKPSMRQIILEEEDALLKIEVLDAMYHLGLIYESGDLNHDNNYAKAAAIFIYCAAFSKKHKVSDADLYLKSAYSVEVKFLKGDSSLELSEPELQIYKLNISKHKARLIEDRDQVRLGLDSIKDLTIREIAQRAARVEEIYSDSSKYLVSDEGDGLLQELLSECHTQLGGVPQGCEFTIIGLGSLSVGTITPWSDLEFGILINQDTEEYKEYFRKLTQLFQIKIINLGETHLRSLGIESLNDFSTAREEDEWFWDDVIEAGISFDGKHWHACKSPLGRKDYKAVKNITKDNGIEESIVEEKKDFELILTPHQMVGFQKEEEKSWFSTDKHLVQALRRVSLIDGSQKLLDSYRDLVSKALHIGIFRDRELEILVEDLGKFTLKLSDEEEGKLLDVKKDMYRLGDRVVVSLSNYYEIYARPGERSINVWQMIDLMRVKGILSPEGAQHLKEAISIASELRLCTYSHNVGQTQEMSTYIPAINHLDVEQRKALVEKTFHIKDTKILHYFYNIMIPVQSIVEDFCKQESHS